MYILFTGNGKWVNWVNEKLAHDVRKLKGCQSDYVNEIAEGVSPACVCPDKHVWIFLYVKSYFTRREISQYVKIKADSACTIIRTQRPIILQKADQKWKVIYT